MQNKGFVSFVTGALALICAYYISFSFVNKHYEDEAEAIALAETQRYVDSLSGVNKLGQEELQKVAEDFGRSKAKAYLDSMGTEKVWLGYTLKEVRKQQIGLGLDLKGGMNVVLKLNAGDLLTALASNPNNQTDPYFYQAIERAGKQGTENGFVAEFVAAYKELNPNANLQLLFGNGKLRELINRNTPEDEVIEILQKEYNAAIDASFNVLHNRIDRFGVVAPNLQRLQGQGRILVELPGIKEPERVRDLLSKTATLEFWNTYRLGEVQEDLSAINERYADNGGLFTKLQLGGYGAVVGYAKDSDRDAIDNILAMAKADGVLRDNLRLLWAAKPDMREGKETDLYALYAIHGNSENIADLTGEVITEARHIVDAAKGGEVSVSMSMDTEGANIWSRLTENAANDDHRCIAIVLDNVVYSAPTVNGKIDGGSSSISGNFTVEEGKDLANVLSSGKMETSIVIEQESVVGPTLGKASIEAGIISFAIALVLLMVYMCLAYGFKPGMVANTALIINSFFTLGILASFHAVLTLSGIAGLVLTLGMAVDANVLINERIKEELRNGKDMSRAIADGYGNAFSAIFDSNLTTIITGAVLFYFGTGPIRGFATTLIIGLVASFITAVFLTRIIFEAMDKRGMMKNVTYDTALTRNLLVDNNYDILGSRKKGYLLPIAILVAGLIGFFTIGLNKGIDFSGGRNYIVKFDQKVDNDQIREALSPVFDNKLVLTSIGTEGDKLRISTNYGIEDDSEEKETEIKNKLAQGLTPFFADKSKTASVDNFEQQIESSQRVSASMSEDITHGAMIAVALSLLFMAIYILIRFRDIAFSIGAFASVTTTTFIIFAVYCLAWKVMPFTMEIDQNFIAAILAIIGYAINDVVVVFDRIREEVALYPNRDRSEVINSALNTTLSRTLNTSFTTFLVMLIVFILGGATMRSFTFVILLGVVFGTYCTLFVATPIAYEVFKSRQKKN